MAQQGYDAKAIGDKLSADLQDVINTNRNLVATPQDQKVLDVSNLKPDGSGIKKIKRTKTGKSTKKFSDSFPLLVSNNWAAYDAATRSLAAVRPDLLDVLQTANGQFLGMFGQLVYVKQQKPKKEKGLTRKQKKVQKDLEKANKRLENPEYVYVDPAVIGMTRVRSPSITVAPIVPTIPGSDLSKPLARIPVSMLNQQELSYAQRIPSPSYSRQLDPQGYQNNENAIDYLTRLQSMGQQNAEVEYSRLSQQQREIINMLGDELRRKAAALTGKSQEEIQRWYALQSPATQRWYQAYRAAEPQQLLNVARSPRPVQQTVNAPRSPQAFLQANPPRSPQVQIPPLQQTFNVPRSPQTQIPPFQQTQAPLQSVFQPQRSPQIQPSQVQAPLQSVFQPSTLPSISPLAQSNLPRLGNGSGFSSSSGSSSGTGSGFGLFRGPPSFGSGLEGRVPQGGSLPTANIGPISSVSRNTSPF